MATYAFTGNNGRINVSSASAQKVAGLNTSTARNQAGMVNLGEVDVAGDSGTETPSEAQTRVGGYEFFGALAGDLNFDLDTDIEKWWWFHDISTGGDITVRRSGGSAGVVLPKNEWVCIQMHDSEDPQLVLGLQAAITTATTPSITLGTNIGNVSGRKPLQARKLNSEGANAGGLVVVEGSIENTDVAGMSDGDALATLPAGWRPSHAMGFIVVHDPETNTNAGWAVIEVSTGGVITLRASDAAIPQNETLDLNFQFTAGN